MKKIVTVIGIVLVAVLGISYLVFGPDDSKLTEAQIREKFGCGRVTADVLATDIYCQNPDYYYEDAKNGTVIDASDFDDPRYKSMYEN